MFVFRKIWRALFSWNTRFEICPFTLLPTISCTEIPDRYAFEVEVRRVEWPLRTNNPSLSICRLLKYGLPHGFWYNLEATEIYIQLSLMFLNASDADLRQTPCIQFLILRVLKSVVLVVLYPFFNFYATYEKWKFGHPPI